jgi:hypothetical protein
MSRLAEPRAPRRVVTAARDGRSIILSDGVVPNAHRYSSIPGMMTSVIYATTASPSLPQPSAETAPPQMQVLPAPGETRLMVVTFPPDSVLETGDFDPAAADAEQRQFIPGLAERFEAGAPGMHQTDSVDYDIVLDGELWLELDDGVSTHLRPGDVVVQCGTRHAWRNKSTETATMCFVLIGGAT